MPGTNGRTDAPPQSDTDALSMRVLASGSGGNCTILVFGEGPSARLTLIDLGLGPRKARAHLRQMGFDFDQVEDILLTHLDGDHCRESWANHIPKTATLRIHSRHMRRAERLNLLFHRTDPFSDRDFELTCGAAVSPLHLSHDSLGVAAFRIECSGSTLGFVTDVGRVSDGLIDHFSGVDVLAIESNYCPKMQMASPRPQFLKDRIMGGAGHLSNQESAAAVRAINPGREVVLLHLSRQCNEPERALREHSHESVNVTVTDQFEPTDWIHIAGPEVTRSTHGDQMGLFPQVASRKRPTTVA